MNEWIILQAHSTEVGREGKGGGGGGRFIYKTHRSDTPILNRSPELRNNEERKTISKKRPIEKETLLVKKKGESSCVKMEGRFIKKFSNVSRTLTLFWSPSLECSVELPPPPPPPPHTHTHTRTIPFPPFYLPNPQCQNSGKTKYNLFSVTHSKRKFSFSP